MLRGKDLDVFCGLAVVGSTDSGGFRGGAQVSQQYTATTTACLFMRLPHAPANGVGGQERKSSCGWPIFVSCVWSFFFLAPDSHASKAVAVFAGAARCLSRSLCGARYDGPPHRRSLFSFFF